MNHPSSGAPFSLTSPAVPTQQLLGTHGRPWAHPSQAAGAAETPETTQSTPTADSGPLLWGPQGTTSGQQIQLF